MMSKLNFEKWLKNVNEEEAITLSLMDTEQIADAFGSEMTFGTGGLRGKMGLGTARMNTYTVKRATRGLVAYLKKESNDPISVAIGYDSRHNSASFAKASAEILANEGISVYLFSELLPTPMLSYAVRRLGCSAGIMITASHNPKEYNGYKVYGSDGCQITERAAEGIYGFIKTAELFLKDDRSFDELLASGMIRYIDNKIFIDFIDEVSEVTSIASIEELSKDVRIAYSPLCGAGRRPVIEALTKNGFTSLTVVKEQEMPNGDFPTCPYPNPELPEAMELGIEYAKVSCSDILIATDPDCDRLGVVVRSNSGEYKSLTGNEVGLLLCDFIVRQKLKNKIMPDRPVAVKTIVTSELSEKMLGSYGVDVVSLLTGFKYIGEYIGKLEARGEADRFILGFEESCGYLNGTYVRDKDGVAAALLVCNMAAYHKAQGHSLLDVLSRIYEDFGYEKTKLRSFTFEGANGAERIANVMKATRSKNLSLDGFDILGRTDYALGIDDLPKTDAIKLTLDRGSVIIRPSGTEPKLKIYVCGIGKDEKNAELVSQSILDSAQKAFGLAD